MYLKLLLVLWRFEALSMYLFYYKYMVEQNPVIPNIQSGAIHYIIYSITVKIVSIVLFIIYKSETYKRV